MKCQEVIDFDGFRDNCDTEMTKIGVTGTTKYTDELGSQDEEKTLYQCSHCKTVKIV